MKDPIKQHIVPKAYLKIFSIPGKEEGFVFTLKIKSKYSKIQIKENHISSICYIKDFYTIATDEPLQRRVLNDRYIIEKQAFTYENKIQALIEKIGKEKRLNSLEAELLITIVLDIKKRNKLIADFYNNESTIKESLLRNLQQAKMDFFFYKDKLQEKGINLDVIFNNVEKLALEQFQDERYRLDLFRESFLDNMDGKGFEKKLIKHLSSKKFYIFKTTSDYPFITNDNPGWTLTKDEKQRNLSFGDWAIFFFPLSPEMLLVIINNEHDYDAHGIIKNLHFVNVSKEIVDYENLASVLNCIEMVISNNIDTLANIKNKYHHNFLAEK